LDELPQLLNVLAGQMSLVGPRPLILDEDQHVERWARQRMNLKPGVTGLWQVLGRSEIRSPRWSASTTSTSPAGR
jgi:lipopolysaccharide/colanic/teichoic acid biosynthesis glycosyltransferase